MKVGKLSTEKLNELILSKIEHTSSTSLSHPKIGEDSALYKSDSSIIAISSDPITGASNNIGSLSIVISSNDIAAAGALPTGVMLTLLLPVDSTEEDVSNIVQDAQSKANELGIDILGGHTEITTAVNKPVMCATSIGNLVKHLPGIKPDTDIVITKSLAIEGTSILFNDFLRDKNIISEELVNEINAMSSDISVIKESKIACLHDVYAMHDITEGGLIGALYEMTYGEKIGFEIDYSKLNIKESTARVCEYFSVDPLYLISSGSLLICVSREDSKALVEDLNKKGISASLIGRFTDKKEYKLIKNGEVTVPERRISDDLYKVVE